MPKHQITLAVLALLLCTACGVGAEPRGPAPITALEAVPGWWQTTPGIVLEELTTLRISMEFMNTSGGDFRFLSSDFMEAWSLPSGQPLAVGVRSQPSGIVDAGETFSFLVEIQVWNQPAGDMRVALYPEQRRRVDSPPLPITPDQAQMTAVSVVVDPEHD